MPVTINKYILLVLLLAFPLILSAQIGKRKYVTRSGDTTLVVMAGSTGLRGEDAQFLLDETISEDFLQKRSRYSRLKEAAIETEQVAGVVDAEQQEMNPSASSLSFRIAQKNIRFLQQDRSTDDLVNRKINSNTPLEEMIYLKEKFGNKPSYFVNGEEVSAATAARIPQKEILSRELRVANTTTGNPNGEIWLVVTSKIYNKLNLEDQSGVSYASQGRTVLSEDYHPAFEEDSSINQNEIEEAKPVIKSDASSLAPEQRKKLSDQQREIEELKKAIQAYTKEDDETGNSPIGVASQYQNYATQPKDTETRVITRKVGNRFVDTDEEVFSFKDTPQERSRRIRDKEETSPILDQSVFNQKEEVIQVTNEAKGEYADPKITKETPKRSVRRIKERQRNQ